MKANLIGDRRQTLLANFWRALRLALAAVAA